MGEEVKSKRRPPDPNSAKYKLSQIAALIQMQKKQRHAERWLAGVPAISQWRFRKHWG